MTEVEPGSPLSATDPDLVGPYRLLRRLGSGAMGRVYLATSQDDPASGPVALKLIHGHLADQPTFRRRFAHELAAMRRIRDPHTVRLLDADTDAEQPWFVSTYVPGPGVDAAVAARGPLPPSEVAQLGIGVARGLAAIHAAQIVHRDLKPANVLLSPQGPVIIDFGIARAADATYLTATGLQVGTFEFMSPEQASGRFVGPPSDVFALGSLLFFAATGQTPFSAASAPAIAQLILSAPPSAEAAASIPPGLRELVLGCLAKDPEQRPSLDALVESLEAVAAGTDPNVSVPPSGPLTEFAPERVVRPAPAPEPATTTRANRRIALAAAAGGALVAAAITTAVLLTGTGAAAQGKAGRTGLAAGVATSTHQSGTSSSGSAAVGTGTASPAAGGTMGGSNTDGNAGGGIAGGSGGSGGGGGGGVVGGNAGGNAGGTSTTGGNSQGSTNGGVTTSAPQPPPSAKFSFEGSTDGWGPANSSDISLAVSSAHARDGSDSLALTDTAAKSTTYVAAVSDRLSNPPGEGVTITAWVYVSSGESVKAALYVQDTAFKQYFPTYSPLGQGWTELSYTCPSSSAARVGISFTKSGSSNAVIYLDEVNWG